MKLLLDTHVFLWYISGDGRLPQFFSAAIQEPTNELNQLANGLAGGGQ